jgi:hypothetical protein
MRIPYTSTVETATGTVLFHSIFNPSLLKLEVIMLGAVRLIVITGERTSTVSQEASLS